MLISILKHLNQIFLFLKCKNLPKNVFFHLYQAYYQTISELYLFIQLEQESSDEHDIQQQQQN